MSPIDRIEQLQSELASVTAELAEGRTAEAAVVKDSFRTELRKTPRTDAAFEHHIASVNRDTCGFRDHARAALASHRAKQEGPTHD